MFQIYQIKFQNLKKCLKDSLNVLEKKKEFINAIYNQSGNLSVLRLVFNLLPKFRGVVTPYYQ